MSDQSKNPLWENNPQCARDANAFISTNAIETFSNIEAFIAFLSEFHILKHPDGEIPLTDRATHGLWICAQAARTAIDTQIEIVNHRYKKGQ